MAWLTRVGPKRTFYLVYKKADGKYTRKSTRTSRRREAERILYRWKLEHGEIEPTDPQRARTPVSVAIDDYVAHLQKTQSPGWAATADGFLRRFKKHVEDRAIGKIGTWDVDTFIAEEHERIKGVSVNKCISVLRGFFRKCIAWRWIDQDPTTGVKNLKYDGLKRNWYLRDEEIDRLIKACDREDIRALITLAADTGGRCRELLELRWGDIDFQEKCLIFRKTKTGPERILPLTSRAVKSLERLPRPLTNEQIFPVGHGDFKAGYRRPFERAVAAAGLESREKPITMHILRHSFGHRMARIRPLREVQMLMGHSNIVTTQRYAHVSSESLREAIGELEEKSHQRSNQRKVVGIEEGR